MKAKKSTRMQMHIVPAMVEYSTVFRRGGCRANYDYVEDELTMLTVVAFCHYRKQMEHWQTHLKHKYLELSSQRAHCLTVRSCDSFKVVEPLSSEFDPISHG